MKDWNSLPRDLFFSIVIKLTIEDIVAFSSSNNQLHQYLNDSPYFWKIKLDQHFSHAHPTNSELQSGKFDYKARFTACYQEEYDGLSQKQKRLFSAVKSGVMSSLRELCEDEDLKLTDKNGRTLLYFAALNGDVTAVRFLLAQKNINVNQADNFLKSPLYIAAARGHQEVIELLLQQQDIDVNKSDQYSKTPLYIASQNGHIKIIELLLEHKDIIATRADGNDKNSPLSVATWKGNSDALMLLLTKGGINVNSGNAGTRGPLLHIAAREGHHEITELLLDIEDVDVNKDSSPNGTALCVAAANDQHEVVKSLLQKESIDVNKPGDHCGSPLYAAAKLGHHTVLALLVANEGADVNVAYGDGKTPLYLAAESGYQQVVELLLGHKDIEVNKADKTADKTPLYIAAQHGHHDVVELLVRQPGIDITKANKYRDTPFSVAKRYEHFTVCELLRGSVLDRYIDSLDQRIDEGQRTYARLRLLGQPMPADELKAAKQLREVWQGRADESTLSQYSEVLMGRGQLGQIFKEYHRDDEPKNACSLM